MSNTNKPSWTHGVALVLMLLGLVVMGASFALPFFGSTADETGLSADERQEFRELQTHLHKGPSGLNEWEDDGSAHVLNRLSALDDARKDRMKSNAARQRWFWIAGLGLLFSGLGCYFAGQARS